MSIRERLRTIACCGMLQMAALFGMPMRPEHVQDLMRALNEPKLADTDPEERRSGDDAGEDAGPPQADQQPQA